MFITVAIPTTARDVMLSTEWTCGNKKKIKQIKETIMKKYLTNYRYWVLTILIAITIILLLSVPTDDTTLGMWFVTMVFSKVVGMCAALLAVFLYEYWAGRNEIECLTDLLKEE